jgi:hypothetical protein
VKLTQSGVTQQDIINIDAVFEKYLDGLEHYGGLKSIIQVSYQSDLKK